MQKNRGRTSQKLSSRRGNNFEIRSTCQSIPLIRNGNSVVEHRTETEKERGETRRGTSRSVQKRYCTGLSPPLGEFQARVPAQSGWLVARGSSRLEERRSAGFPGGTSLFLSLSLSHSSFQTPDLCLSSPRGFAKVFQRKHYSNVPVSFAVRLA